MAKTTRVMGHRWIDLGSDVDYLKYGGCWGWPMPTDAEPDRWAVIRFEVCDTSEDWGAVGSAVFVCVSQVKNSDLDTVGLAHDGKDEFGEPYKPQDWAALKVGAYIQTWGDQGVAGGEEFQHPIAHEALRRAVLHLRGPLHENS